MLTGSGVTEKNSEQKVAMLKKGLSPDVVGEQVLEVIISDQRYIFTDPNTRGIVQ